MLSDICATKKKSKMQNVNNHADKRLYSTHAQFILWQFLIKTDVILLSSNIRS